MSQSVTDQEPTEVAVEEAEAVAHVAPLERDGGGDLMESLAFPLPVRVMAELLGVPLADVDQFRPLMQDLAGLFESAPACSTPPTAPGSTSSCTSPS